MQMSKGYTRKIEPLEYLSFDDADVIKLLILERFYILDHHKLDSTSQKLNESRICIYISLDSLIAKTKLTKKQRFVLELFFAGYNHTDIVEIYGIKSYQVLENACKRIADTYKRIVATCN